MRSRIFPRFVIALVIISFFGAAETRAQKYEPAGLNMPPPQPDLFEVSLGFNYIYLGDAFPETRDLYGFETSAFVNATPWLAVGGEFMADFGSRNVSTFLGGLAVDSQRYIYVFGPRVTLWRNQQFRVFAEALAGGVHAEAQATVIRFTNRTASASDDGFAMAVGAGFDWRFGKHLSWRIIQADYLPTNLGNDWQSNFRASTAIVYSFGTR